MRATYYRNLHSNPKINLRLLLPLIKAAEQTGQPYGLKEPVSLSGWDYTLFVAPEIWIDEDRLITLLLKWEDEGEQHSQTIPILREESHLISGSFVYYFLCGGYKAKKLFYIGGQFRSRKSFPHRYPGQNLSRRSRETRYRQNPERKYGKQRYRGRLTPYGLRLQRYYERESRAAQGIVEYLQRIITR